MIRKRLLAGLFSLLPLGITVWFLSAVFQLLIGIFHRPLLWLARLFGIPEPGYWQQAVFSILAMACLLFAVGALVQNFIGRRIFSWLDALMMNVPGVKSVYGATKQIMSAVQSGKDGSFKEVVVVPWPNSDSKTIGFVTHRECAWAVKDGSSRVVVYIPTSPIPTSGYVVMLDESAVQSLDITPEQALTWVVSGGAVIPHQKK
ncbi:MAG: DUF502 domain-containing protein [Holophagales bacterium]|nr:DUF502 domain-containing protein [Holophagales bacterium]